MFAFAIIDGPRRKLVAARDRFGIKPLYYARMPGGGLALASELGALLRVPGLGRDLDLDALWHYLSLRFVPGDGRSSRASSASRPGHALEVDLDTGEAATRRWYRLGSSPTRASIRKAWVERLRTALAASVSRWSLADVPIACSLSGGLDSSAVVALLAESGHSDLRTYTLGFTSDEDDALNELPLARALARALRHGAPRARRRRARAARRPPRNGVGARRALRRRPSRRGTSFAS